MHINKAVIRRVRASPYCPGTNFETKPDYVLVMAWNILDEIMEQMSGIRAWGGEFAVAIPSLQIIR